MCVWGGGGGGEGLIANTGLSAYLSIMNNRLVKYLKLEDLQL